MLTLLTHVASLALFVAAVAYPTKSWRNALKGLLMGLFVYYVSYLINVLGLGNFDAYGAFAEGPNSIAFSLIFAGLLVLAFVVQRLVSKKNWLLPLEKQKLGLIQILARGLSLIVFLVSFILFFASFWINRWFGAIPGDQLLFTLIAPGGSESNPEIIANMWGYIYLPVLFSVLLVVALGFAPAFKLGKRTFSRKLQSYGGLAVSLILLVLSSVYVYFTLPIQQIYEEQVQSSSFIKDNYVAPTAEVLSFPEKKKNVVMIVLESMESSYFDKAHGGYMKQNLMPELLALSDEGYSFSNGATYGGALPTVGASHSVAGITNMLAGVPYKNRILSNDRHDYMYSNFETMGDILQRQGYQCEWMMGAKGSWGNFGDWIKKHGDVKLFDYSYARNNGFIPKNYKVWWGYEDDKLYDWAKGELNSLAAGGKPFFMVIENADTHFPNGYVSKKMKVKPFKEQYANVIHYSQAEVVSLVRWMQEQSWYKDTTVILVGDHLSMDKKFFKNWDENYQRTPFNLILNSSVDPSSKSLLHNREFAAFDLFPTYLEAMGVEVKDHRVGLGTSLFSGRKTLMEELGPKRLNRELNKRSDFYWDYEPSSNS